MKTRKLRDIEVSEIGYGCMGFSHGYGALPPKEEAIRLIRMAYEMGCTHFEKKNVTENQPLLDMLNEFAAKTMPLRRRFLLHGCCTKITISFLFRA